MMVVVFKIGDCVWWWVRHGVNVLIVFGFDVGCVPAPSCGWALCWFGAFALLVCVGRFIA